MTKRLDFADGYSSATAPTVGAILDPNTVTGVEILLNNNETLNGKSQDGLSEIPIAKIKTTNEAELSTVTNHPHVPTAPDHVVNKTYADLKQSLSEKGAANGYAPLNASGLIESTYLPSYVDDVLEYANLAAFPVTGTAGIIYVAIDTSKTYRWSGSTYVEISPSSVESVNGETGIVSLVAGDIPFTPTGATTSTELQSAIVELQDDINLRATNNDLNIHILTDTTPHATIENTSLRTPTRLDAKIDTKANLTTYATTASNGQLTFASDTKEYHGIVDGVLTAIGGGGGTGSLNNVFQLKAEEETTDWGSGNNASFLGGGTLSGTFAKETTSPIHESSSYKYTQAAGSLNDYLASPVQSVDPKFRGAPLFVTFPYKYDGSNGDLKVVVYDVTNSTIISSSLETLDASLTLKTMAISFVMPSNCSSVRVGFQVLAVNSGKIFEFDDIEMSSTLAQNINVTDKTFVKMEGSSARGSTDTIVVKFDTTAILSGKDIEIVNTTANGTYFRMLASGSLTVSSNLLPNATNAVCHITKNQATLTGLSTTASEIQAAVQDYTATGTVNLKATFDVIPGDIIRVTSNATSAADPKNNVLLTLVKNNSSVVLPVNQVSSDNMVFSFKSTAIVDIDPVGTFNTYTYASGTNTATISTTAPTQTTSSMNIDGVLVYARAYNATSTSAQPTRFDIKIGKGLRAKDVALYLGASKTTEASYDYSIQSTTTETGTFVKYSEKTGILAINCGVARNATNTARFVDGDNINFSSSGYFVFNASSVANISAIPELQPRIATISHVVASGTNGGSATQNVYATRSLNTLSDPMGVVTSLSSNQFTLQAGTYFVRGHAPAYLVGTHRLRVRNITDSSTPITGTTSYHPALSAGGDSVIQNAQISGHITITSAKVFELQHYTTDASIAASDFGLAMATGESEVYAVLEITKIR